MPAIYSSIRLSFISIHSLIHPSIHPSIHPCIHISTVSLPFISSDPPCILHVHAFTSLHLPPYSIPCCLQLPSLTLPCLKLPSLALSSPVYPVPCPCLLYLPCPLPCLALPCLTLSCLALPYLAMSYCHVMWQWQCSGARGTASSSIRNSHEGNVVRRIHQGIV